MSKRTSRWDSDSDTEVSNKKELKKIKKIKKKSTEDNIKKNEIASESNTDNKNTLINLFNNKISSDLYRNYDDLSCGIIDDYECLNYISEGTYGMVFRAKHKKTEDIYAIKFMKINKEFTDKNGFSPLALKEINILLNLQHPNIVKVHKIVIGMNNKEKIYMIMDYCENDLKEVMKNNKQKFSIAEIKRLIYQLLSAVAYLHSKWFLHRDLKTSNLLYHNQKGLQICDFGLARKFHNPSLNYTKEVVTLWYRCPELLLGAPTYSSPLDMWSVGCIFAEIMTETPLFPGQGEPDQISLIFKRLGQPQETWPDVENLPLYKNFSMKHFPPKSKLRELFPVASFSGAHPLSDQGYQLLSGLLRYDPNKRLTAQKALNHPWLTNELPLPTSEDKMPKFLSSNISNTSNINNNIL